MRVYDPGMLDDLVASARGSERQRKNHNVHARYDEPCQRLFNAVEPDSYVRPHRHTFPAKPETFVAVRGKMAVLLFSDEGRVEEVAVLRPDGVIAVDIQPGAWHAVLALESGSIFFECKPGPYEPISDKDWAPWAPEEGSAEATEYLEALRAAARRHAPGEGGASLVPCL